MNINILGIETSCDETAAAVVQNGGTILSNVVLSQINTHAAFGGVVPEVASRKHLEAIIPVIDEAVHKSGLTLDKIDAIAVTYGPGLVGALLVGLSFAKGLARAKKIPLIGIHHVAAHIMASRLTEAPPEPPFTALVVSGGHSSVFSVRDVRTFIQVGRTRDDAAGEAFDKVARFTGLGYPGGQKLEAAAVGGDPGFIRFPRTAFRDGSFDFSFSGVKTAAINCLKKELAKYGGPGPELPGKKLPGAALPGAALHNATQPGPELPGGYMRDFYASYQAAIVDALVNNTLAAERGAGTGKIVVAGGVAANGALRRRFAEAAANGETGSPVTVFFPPPALCTDNAAMVAAAAYHDYIAGNFSDLTINAAPAATLEA